MIPYFKIQVSEADELGVDFNSFVDVPAHLKGFLAFGKEERYNFNDEKRIVTGVMISAGTPIYRNSKEMGEHYVVFDAETIDIIRKKFFKNNYTQNVNLNHNEKDITNGATLIDSYIVSNSNQKYPNIPQAFESQKLKDGSWIASYYVTDDVLWDNVKSGKFNGFSVEGWFDKVKVNIKKKNKMKKERKSIWDMFGLAPEKSKFTEATTADGVIVMYDGELVEGTVLTTDLEGEQLPLQAGEYQLILADEKVVIIVVDEAGAVVTVEDFNPDADAPADDANEEMKKQVAEAMKNVVTDVDERFKKLETENTELKAKLEAINEGEKFKANPKKEVKPTSRRDLLNK